jgi:hypothetical protein
VRALCSAPDRLKAVAPGARGPEADRGCRLCYITLHDVVQGPRVGQHRGAAKRGDFPGISRQLHDALAERMSWRGLKRAQREAENPIRDLMTG